MTRSTNQKVLFTQFYFKTASAESHSNFNLLEKITLLVLGFSILNRKIWQGLGSLYLILGNITIESSLEVLNPPIQNLLVPFTQLTQKMEKGPMNWFSYFSCSSLSPKH